MSKKFFDKHTVESLIDEECIETEVIDTSSRWTNEMMSIVQDPETGKFYRLYWQQGKTEAQENEYYADNFDEVKLVPNHITVSIANGYLSEEQIKAQSNELLENIKALPLIVVDKLHLEQSQQALSQLNISDLLAKLDDVSLFNVTESMTNEKAVVVDYLKKLETIQKEL